MLLGGKVISNRLNVSPATRLFPAHPALRPLGAPARSRIRPLFRPLAPLDVGGDASWAAFAAAPPPSIAWVPRPHAAMVSQLELRRSPAEPYLETVGSAREGEMRDRRASGVEGVHISRPRGVVGMKGTYLLLLRSDLPDLLA
jgi:hypothetical protein